MSFSSSALRRRAVFGADFICKSRWILARPARSDVQRHSPVPLAYSRAAAPTYAADYLRSVSAQFSAGKLMRFDGELCQL
jgi:hypothetical protein